MTLTRISVAGLTYDEIRDLLVKVSLEWERRFSVAPGVTSSIAEYDAAKLKETTLEIDRGRDASYTAVTRGVDFRKGSVRYQVKANRPSRKTGQSGDVGY